MTAASPSDPPSGRQPFGPIPGLAGLTVLGMLAEPGARFASAQGPEGGVLLPFVILAVLSLGAAALICLPGLLFALALGRGDDGPGAVLARGFALSIFGLTLITSTLSAVFSVSLTGPAFALCLGGLSALGLLACRARGIRPRVPETRYADLLVMGMVPLAVLALLLPKFVFESFNGDGAHVFQSMRHLIATGNPFWPDAAGAIASYPSMSTLLEVLAGSWWVRLFGESELAARLPVLGGLALLTGMVLDLIRMDRPAPLPGLLMGAVGAAMVLYAATYGWQASYNPYFADIALPLAREPLVMVAYLGFILAFTRKAYGAIFVFGLLTYMAIPSAPVLIALFLGAVFLVWRPIPWVHLILSGLLVGLAFAIGLIVPILLARAGLISASDEFGAGNLLGRLRFVTPFEVERFAYWIVPCGILPALGLLAWFWQDRLARVLALCALGYFGFFYLQAYRVLPHHFAPVPILALIVFWRLAPVRRYPGPVAGLALAGVLAGLWLAAPAHWAPHTHTADFARQITYEDSRYDQMAPAEFRIAHDLLGAAFPMDFADDAPARRYIGSPLAWYTYAAGPKAADVPAIYVIRAGPAVAGETQLAQADGHVLVTSDPAAYEADRDRGGLARSLNDLFYVPRRVIFGRGPRDGPRPVWDLARIAGLR